LPSADWSVSDLLLQAPHEALAAGGTLGEVRLEVGGGHILRGFPITVGAVQRRFDQAVQNLDGAVGVLTRLHDDSSVG
jgi:hypothetical protein